ncbi:MAG: ChaN family lipoprotein [Prolixibacteraceae bacterium]|nr:ChaN family lipoprotein [Prolixibacteraceae bacterium]
MNKFQILLIAVLFLFSAFKTDKPSYLLFDKKGKAVKYEKMMKELNDADIVLFGELHTNPVIHWLELEVAKDLFDYKKDDLILAAEMFETDNQLILTEYVNDIIATSRFEEEAKLWPNYSTDYKPLVEFARQNKLQFVASNIPRRYATLVNLKGFEALEELSDDAKAFLPPLPVDYDPELNCYKSLLNMDGISAHTSPNIAKAQAIKDATMANSILKYWKRGKTLIHFHGAYHSGNFESIYWYLKKANPNLKIVTIHSVEQIDVSELSEENTGAADFTICVDEDMTKTRQN